MNGFWIWWRVKGLFESPLDVLDVAFNADGPGVSPEESDVAGAGHHREVLSEERFKGNQTSAFSPKNHSFIKITPL